MIAASVSLSGQNFNSSIRYWDKGKLTLDDFVIREMWSADENQTSALEYGWNEQLKSARIGNLKYDRVCLRTYMDNVNSWIKSGYANQQTLKFCQVAFDLVEATRRKLQSEIDTSANVSSESLSDFYGKVCSNATNEFKAASKEGTDTAVVSRYRAKLDKMFSEYAPEDSVPVISFGKWGYGLHCGFGGEIYTGEAADYLPPRYGLNLGFEVTYSEFRFNFDMFLGSGASLRKDLPFWKSGSPEDVHSWNKGESFNAGNVELTFGYAAVDNGHFTVAPMIGLGVGFIDRLDKYIDGNGSDNGEEISAFRMLAGVNADWKLLRHYRSSYNGFKDYMEHNVRFKVYAARTGFRSPCDAFSVNFAVAYNLYGRTVK